MSDLPGAGRVEVVAHRPIDRLLLRIPDGCTAGKATVLREPAARAAARRGTELPGPDSGPPPAAPAEITGTYAAIAAVKGGERIVLEGLPLEERETVERVQDKEYAVRWKGSTVLSIAPPGTKVPLYAGRGRYRSSEAPAAEPRYP